MKMTRDYLCQLVADRYVEEMDLHDLQDFVAGHMYDNYMQYYGDRELLEEAITYGIIDEDEPLEIES